MKSPANDDAPAERFDNIDPATNERLCEVAQAGRAQVDAAVASAREGFADDAPPEAVADGDEPGLKEGNPVAQAVSLSQVMGTQEDGPALAFEFGDEIPHQPGGFGVQAAGRLVQEDQGRFVHEGTGDG